MTKNHLKRLASPIEWGIKRKGTKYVANPNPGPHTKKTSVPLNFLIISILNYAKNSKEAKNILQNKEVLINGTRRKDTHYPVGLFDVVEIKQTKEFFRLVFGDDGRIKALNIDSKDAEIKPYRIADKKNVKGKTELNLFDGTNIVQKAPCKTYDTLVLSVPKKEIKERIEFKKGNLIYLVSGKHVGKVGKVEDTTQKKVIYKIGTKSYETLKKYAFVVGKEKPVIRLDK